MIFDVLVDFILSLFGVSIKDVAKKVCLGFQSLGTGILGCENMEFYFTIVDILIFIGIFIILTNIYYKK